MLKFAELHAALMSARWGFHPRTFPYESAPSGAGSRHKFSTFAER